MVHVPELFSANVVFKSKDVVYRCTDGTEPLNYEQPVVGGEDLNLISCRPLNDEK